MSNADGANQGGSRSRTPNDPSQQISAQSPTEENVISDSPKLSDEERQRATQLRIEAANAQRDHAARDRRLKYADSNTANQSGDLDSGAPSQRTEEERRTAQIKATAKGLPPEWRDRLLPNRDEFVLRDEPKVAVFSVNNDTLKTRLNDPEVARLLAATADERGWSRIQVKGTETFRREVWVEATARGVDAKGYKPTEVDYHEASLRAKTFTDRNQVKADQKAIENLEPGAMARRNEQHRMVAAAIGATNAHIKDTVPNASDQRVIEQAVRDSLAQTNGKQVRDIKMRDPEGKIVAMGYEKYKFDSDQSRSFYVRLERDGKTRDIWGVGLADAVTQARAKQGDYVQVQQTGSRTVEVKVPIRNNEGRVTGSEMKQVKRNEFQMDVQNRAPQSNNQASRVQQDAQMLRQQQKTQHRTQSRGRSR